MTEGGFFAATDATPLDPDATAELIPPLQTQADLNEFEAANITEAAVWTRRSRLLLHGYPSPKSLLELHRRMFDRTWRWAGRYRRTDTNLGVPWPQVSVAVRQLCDDTCYQVQHASVDPDHLCVGFHHRLVSIHPFPNGNGRLARIATDVLRRNASWPAWTWGAESLVADGEVRSAYIKALRAADGGDLAPLIAFVR
ncbi:MAG: mobile mystery protein B [Candidatus Dormibacter sp.]